MAQVLDHDLQVRHMVVGQALDLLLFPYLEILFLHLGLELDDPVFCAGKLLITAL